MATFLGGASIGGDSVSGDKIVHMAAVPPEDGRPPRQLPPDVPGFTGRQAVLSQLNELISAEDRTGPVIAAITGMPGIGKTALAVHWAHLISGRFPDGHIFIDLRGCSKRAALSPREALGQALRALRAPAERLPVDEDELAASYRSRLADKRMLIVLDDAAGSRQVYPLIPGSPSCVVVVTARGKLAGLVARYGARATALELLPASEALDLISVVAGRQRAEAEPEATMELVHMCARLPLALRMAAANLAIRPQQTVADTVEALAEGDRLSNLTLGEDPREAVGAAFELSYRGLFPEAQRAFRLLGLVDGPNVVPDAVGALLAATPEAARRLLGQLEAASLVEAIGGNRYHLHELLHDYARGRAAQDDSPIVRSAAIERLATWYLTTAQQAGRFLDRYRRTMRQELTAPPVNADPAERTHHLDWFALEQPNLTELTRQVARLRWDELTWELADAVYDFFELRRYCHENLEVQRLGLAAAQRKSNLVALFFMHHHLAVIHRELGQARESLAEDALALEISVQTQDRYGEAAALDNMARTHLQLSDYSMTLELGRRALSIRREIGDRHGEAMTLDTLARGRLGLSQYRGSFELAREALLIRRAIGDLRGEAETLDNIARIYHGWGRINESLHSAERALEICKEVGDRHGEGQTLAFLGYLYMWIGSHAQGRAHAERSLDIRQKIDDPHGEGQALVYLSTIRRRLGRYEEAVQSGLEALDILQALGDRHGEAETLESLSRSFRRMGMYERARRDAERSLAIRRSIRDVHGSAKALNALGLIELHSGHPNLARSAAKRALRLRRRLDDQPGIADSLDLLGKIYLRMGRSEKALRTAERALDVAERIGQHYGQIITLGSLGEILWRLDRREAALERLQLARQMAAQMGDLHEEAKVLRLQAEIHAELGRPDQSQAATVEAASLIRELDKLP